MCRPPLEWSMNLLLRATPISRPLSLDFEGGLKRGVLQDQVKGFHVVVFTF